MCLSFIRKSRFFISARWYHSSAMEFSVKVAPSVVGAAENAGEIRRGNLSLTGRTGRMCRIETPGCFVHTQTGSIPHLTPDDLQYIDPAYISNPPPLNMALASLSMLAPSVEAFGKPLSTFVGYPDSFVYLGLNDPLKPPKPGSNEKSSMGLWNRAGKVKVSPEAFLDLNNKLHPDMLQIICDMDTQLVGASGQRLTKSFDSSLSWLDLFLKSRQGSPVEAVPVLATVGGGSDPWRRENFCKEVATRAVDGFVVDGFGDQWLSRWKEWESTGDLFESHKDLVSLSLRALPETKPRFLHAPLPPKAVIYLVEMGVDMFDTSYAAALADRREALIRTEDYAFDVISLGDQKYFEDLTPLSTRWACYTCKNYTKAYLHHLIHCQEINGGVLLMIHNLNEYLKFFHDLRQTIDNGSISLWKSQSSHVKVATNGNGNS
ncbi:putative Queuine tRNA-ribosyltransferase subunit qtrtd1 [Hypsibius exemplaris]|uniref:Queuine tRNA-ribosyltransferase accessory subunit 2 n=1 Tax=Hypsibius exemplaris TaxID=2072580 RepID=A0A1W0X4F0_HYPEX|nr:putative Queuine tRNA-ribosyltransferase subunit qtrtd1 [Hypsibius exemplaris]